MHVFFRLCWISFSVLLKLLRTSNAYIGLPWWYSGKESACRAGDTGSVPGCGRQPGGGNGNLLQDPSLGKPVGRGAWQTAARGVGESWTQLAAERTSAQAALGKRGRGFWVWFLLTDICISACSAETVCCCCFSLFVSVMLAHQHQFNTAIFHCRFLACSLLEKLSYIFSMLKAKG